jgi:hypothetical protein
MKKQKKKRGKKYNTKLAISGTLDDVLKASVGPDKKQKKT